MHERYGCDGKMQANRTAAYFEYPSTVAILLREIRYGIMLGYTGVVVDPMPRAAFNYHVGNVNVDFKPNGTSYITLPVRTAGGEELEYQLHGMLANSKYTISVGVGCASVDSDTTAKQQLATTASDGLLRFHASPGPTGCGISVAPAML
jgi:hypothetical protein